MGFKNDYTLIEVKDLKPESIYGKVNPYASNVRPTLVYLSKIFKSDEYKEVTEGLNFQDTTLMEARDRRGCTTDFALYTRLNENGFTSWIVDYACNYKSGAGFIEVSRKLVPEIEKFVAHVDKLNDLSIQMQKILDNGFPTILDALARVTGQRDLKKKIEKEPQLVKLFERIDDSLS
jgi:hypothetical protein